MGLNSVIMILNDAYHEINDNPRVFWMRAWDALCRASQLPFDFGPGKALVQHHADYTSLIAVGGNYGTVIGTFGGVAMHHTPEGQLALLKQAAEKLGYKLTKIAMRTCLNCGKRTKRFKYGKDARIICPKCFEEEEKT